MTRICWWFADILSRMLEPDEREVARGDIAESAESGGQALRDVFGLVVRRQAALWMHWRPWLTLVGLIVPLSVLLSIVSKSTADRNATFIWLYANNWDWALLKHFGFWYELGEAARLVFVTCLTLVCWSWTSGFVLGSLSRRMVQVYGVLFCLMLMFGAFLAAPRYFAYLLQYPYRPPSPDSHDPVLALVFYRELFPLIVQAVLVAVPFLWGMSRGADARRRSPLLRIILWIAAAGALTTLVVQQPGLGFLLNAYWLPRIWRDWPKLLLQLMVYWPVLYLAASAIGRCWRGKLATT